MGYERFAFAVMSLPQPADQSAHQYGTIIDLLRQRAQERPHQIAYWFLKGESQPTSITYLTLDQQAQTVAAWLKQQVPTGTRVLLVYPYDAGLEFIAAFLGCLYAGMIAVSSHPPRNRSGLIELHDRLVSAEAAVILSTKALLPKLKKQLAEFPQVWTGCATDTLPAAPFTLEQPIDFNSLAFLQYTSGSTGKPKGVMITHSNLIQNQRLLQLAFGHSEDSVGVGWLPLFHDMGLIGNVLQALYLGASCVLMSPLDFVQKPIRWLQAISDYKATTSGAPNFAYDLLCRKVTPDQLQQLDLSSWQVAFTGAEPVRVETLERFSQTFAPCGFQPEAFYPCYGMAEATLFISGGKKLTPPHVLRVEEVALEQNRVVLADEAEAGGAGESDGRTLVSCGQGWLDTEIAIVDPISRQRCQPDQVGEIWVTGSGLGHGYWQQPELTEQTFEARIQDEPDRQYLRTGDLGFLHNGELFVTGRLNDVLVFWGFNHYPQHIEQTVETCHPGFRPDSNAAFAVKINNEERLIIAQEVERQYRGLGIDEVVELIRWRVFEQHFVDVFGILLLKPGSLPKTSSGKVKRSACRTLFLNQQLEILDQWQLSPDSPNDPSSVMERYLNLSTHLKRYVNLTSGKIQRWLSAIRPHDANSK
jgi:acyl-CoA synthetase (AMP-forming)/AMP-acid ligase II